MNLDNLLTIANDSGGTLYLMAVLMLIALTVIIERTRHLLNMQSAGEQDMPHTRIIQILEHEPTTTSQERVADHLEEALMHEVPMLDKSLWMLDTVITLAPLLGLFGTIIGMFNAFSVLDDIQNAASQVTGGIAEALVATACGLLIAMIGLIFFNWLNTHVRVIVHQLETLKVMLLNRRAGQQRH